MPGYRCRSACGIRGQVERERVVEHRVGSTPCQQRGHGERAQLLGHLGQRGSRRMRRGERHIGHELGDGPTITSCSIRRAIGLARRGRDAPPGQAERAVDEDASAVPDQIGDGASCRETDERWSPPARRHRDARVAQHHPCAPITGCNGPAHRDSATPIVPGNDDGPFDLQRLDHVAEIANSIGVTPWRRALGVAHAQLIDGDHAIAVTQPCEHAAPEDGPGGVAVHADDGAHRRGRTTLEHMPTPRDAIVPRYVHEPRPLRFHLPPPPLIGRRCCRCCYHVISVRLVFNPDPMPRHTMRWPASNSCCTPARVMGIAAGPTLPNLG